MSRAWTRRDVLRGGLALASAGTAARCAYRGSRPPPLPDRLPDATPWPEANAVIARTVVPTFPAATFAIDDHGAGGAVVAVGDGRTDATAAIARTIAACRAAGGGRVLVPPGTWLTGAIRLLDGVDLHVERGATLLFSDDQALYPPVLTRHEGIECVNRSPMIYAHGAVGVAVTGAGVLDASRTAAWNRGGPRAGILDPMVARGVPAGQRSVVGRLRTSFVQTYACRNVLVQGVTLRGACFWQIHPVLCTDVTVDGVTTEAAGANTDGCNPDSCARVIIKRCTLGSGDDNIALKSGRDDDGRRVATPCEDVVIMNCQAEGRFGFLCIGSEQTGGIRNVYAFNNWTYGRGVGSMLWIKSNSRRGGYTRNVRIDRFEGAGFRHAVVEITMAYEGQRGDALPAFDGIHLSNLRVSGAPLPFDLQALAASPLGSLTVRDAQFLDMASPRSRLLHAPAVTAENVTINGKAVATGDAWLRAVDQTRTSRI